MESKRRSFFVLLRAGGGGKCSTLQNSAGKIAYTVGGGGEKTSEGSV